MSDSIYLQINGEVMTGFTSATLQVAINSICRGFSLQLSQGDSLSVKPEDEVKLFINNDLWLTGAIDRVEATMSSGSRIVTISGRSSARNVIDCSIVGLENGGLFVKKTSLEIIRAILVTFDVGFQSTVTTEPNILEKFEIQDGETGFSAIDRICKLSGYIARSTATNDVEITQASQTRETFETPYINGSIVYDTSQRKRNYIVKCRQDGRNISDPEEVCSVQASVIDNEIKSDRSIVIRADEPTDKDGALLRAIRARQTEIGRSKNFNATFGGLTLHGKPWQDNLVFFINDNALGIKQDMTLQSITFSYAPKTSEVNCSFVDPNTYVTFDEIKTINQSQEMWK